MTSAPINLKESILSPLTFDAVKDEVPNSKSIKEYIDSIPAGYQPGFFNTNFSYASAGGGLRFMEIPNYADRSGIDIIQFGKFGGYTGPRPDPSNDMFILDWDNSKYYWYEYTAPMNIHNFLYRTVDGALNPITSFIITYFTDLVYPLDNRFKGFQLYNISDRSLTLTTTATLELYTATPGLWNEFTKIHLH